MMSGDDIYVLGAIGLLTLCSFLTRSGYFLFGDYLPLTEPVRRALRYAPTAALIGIVIPEIFPWQQGVGQGFELKAVAAVVGSLVFLPTGSQVDVIVKGAAGVWGQ